MSVLLNQTVSAYYTCLSCWSNLYTMVCWWNL